VTIDELADYTQIILLSCSADMRLLSTQNWGIKDFISDDQVPPYAILSHTWDEDEVNFQQWENMEFSDISHMKGYSKIKKFGEQAAIDGFDWVWVDTYAHPNPC
jgi:hypothetical protein